MFLLQSQEIGIFLRIERFDTPSSHVGGEFGQGVDGVDAHHLVVDIPLKTVQAAECRRFWAVAGQPTKLHGRAVQFPLHNLHFHFNGVVGVNERLLPHPLRLAGRSKQFLIVQVLDLDVRVVNAVLAKQKGQLGVRCVNRIVGEKHLIGPASNEQRVVVHHGQLGPSPI